MCSQYGAHAMYLAVAVASSLVLPARALRGVQVDETPGDWWNVGGAVGGLLPSPYMCQMDTAEFGTVDRWISVQPEPHGATAVASWLSPSEWEAWMKNSTYETPQEFGFEPFILRSRAEYEGRAVIKVVESTGIFEGDNFVEQGTPCTIEYKMDCSAKGLHLLKQDTCKVLDEESYYFGNFQKQRSFSPHGPEQSFPFSRTFKKKDIYVLDETGDWGKVQEGFSVAVSILDPTKGITLSELDSDVMVAGSEDLELRGATLEKVIDHLDKTVIETRTKLGNDLKEGIQDIRDAMKKVNNSNISSSDEENNVAIDKGAKWIKKLTLDSMVPTCLCCDQKRIDESMSYADHCMMAYTLGGQNKSDTINYNMKMAAGTMYNLVKRAGSWVVPYVGGRLVSQAQKQSCHFACDMRQPLAYEPYRFGKVRQVPGLAMKTWFVPDPESFFSGAADELAAEGLGGAVVS
mmetsp:Transcript_22052/g.48217  ORF Transcript_22052/g.48217 Transcript_22052/m.48217 type:complete len:461 (+) Transcript_22052:69-1451(+)